jgi:hypothetical protein
MPYAAALITHLIFIGMGYVPMKEYVTHKPIT